METKSGRSTRLSDGSTSSSRISRPGSAVDLIFERISAFHAATRNCLGAVHAELGAVVMATRDVLESGRNSLERLETSPASKFVQGWI